MNKKSTFSLIMTVVIVALICITLTIAIAVLVGSAESDLFDLSKLNWSNVIPVIIIGGFISCIVVGIVVLFVSKNIFLKVRDYLFETNKEEEKRNEK